MNSDNNREYAYRGMLANGFMMLAVEIILLPALAAAAALLLPETPGITLAVILGMCWAVMLGGFFTQQPNQARVCIFFGKYKGTIRETGFYWINPFMSLRKVSLRIRNMDIAPIKVNDRIGNPVMIGMVLVWKVSDTYQAVFDIDSTSASAASGSQQNVSLKALDNFVGIQSDAALREVTGQFAYDDSETDGGELTLRSGGQEINELLETKINERVAMAGISVVEARINYLAYAPEIAAVMLRRQQASAIISAREKIVEGAVSMVKMALQRLGDEKIVELTEERKAAMVGDLLVVLCADEPAKPVLNTGSE